MNHDGHETRYRIRRLPQWVLEPAKVIRRPYIAELIMASGHTPASKGRTYDCTAQAGSCLHKPLAYRAVPHMRQTQQGAFLVGVRSSTHGASGRTKAHLVFGRLRLFGRSCQAMAGGWQQPTSYRGRLALSVRSSDKFCDRAGRRPLHDRAAAPRSAEGGDPGRPIGRLVIATFLSSRTST